MRMGDLGQIRLSILVLGYRLLLGLAKEAHVGGVLVEDTELSSCSRADNWDSAERYTECRGDTTLKLCVCETNTSRIRSFFSALPTLASQSAALVAGHRPLPGTVDPDRDGLYQTSSTTSMAQQILHHGGAAKAVIQLCCTSVLRTTMPACYT